MNLGGPGEASAVGSGNWRQQATCLGVSVVPALPSNVAARHYSSRIRDGESYYSWLRTDEAKGERDLGGDGASEGIRKFIDYCSIMRHRRCQ